MLAPRTKDKFSSLDLGTGAPSSVPMEVIEVEISPEVLLGDYACAFMRECSRTQSLRVRTVSLTEDEVFQYACFLLDARIKTINAYYPAANRLKIMAIPAFLQYCLENIGRVVRHDVGLTMVPVMSKVDVISFEDALIISDKIASFEDSLVILRDAMPRSLDGNVEVMSTALIAGYVRSQQKISPVSSYISAFLGLKLRKENAFQMLYRVQYDDLEYIRMALTRSGGLF